MSAAAASAVEPASQPIHTLSLFVNNKPGVLVRVALVFSRRGFNIESLVVSPGAEGRFSRLTMTCRGAAADLDQVVRQLAKLVDVVHAIDHTGDLSYEVEIALVKLDCALDRRTEILQIAEHYKARVVDYGSESLMIQVHGSSEKLDACLELLRPFGISELVRSGKLLMARGRKLTCGPRARRVPLALVLLPGAARGGDRRRRRLPRGEARDARVPGARLELPPARAERARARDVAARGRARRGSARAERGPDLVEAARFGLPLDDARLGRLGLERDQALGGAVGVAAEVVHLELVEPRQHLEADREVPGRVPPRDPLAARAPDALHARRALAVAEHRDLLAREHRPGVGAEPLGLRLGGRAEPDEASDEHVAAGEEQRARSRDQHPGAVALGVEAGVEHPLGAPQRARELAARGEQDREREAADERAGGGHEPAFVTARFPL